MEAEAVPLYTCSSHPHWHPQQTQCRYRPARSKGAVQAVPEIGSACPRPLLHPGRDCRLR
jgi:hypothetical protein